ncbi:MAG: tRNA threonylcarbamoyladenosine dehydratase [Clostridia bacterium]|nr:tRNA threonylcarbamoyladenosine dehydratase [Clostridia bacterium]
MDNQFSRLSKLLGEDATEKLKKVRVAVFGIGGVGGYAVEALARSGVGTLDLIDNDTVALSNLNRQIIALHSTVGRYKADVMAERVADINPKAKVNTYKVFYLPETAEEFDFTKYDYIVDAVDTVSAKISLAERACAAGVPIISAMGTGNKLDATRLCVTDINKTSVCPLAKVMRYELRKRGIKKLKVVYSEEIPIKPEDDPRTPGSTAFVPGAAGLIIAGEVIKDILNGVNK